MRSQSSDYHEKEIIKQLKKSNYYDVLDLQKNASQGQIKKSFKQMALKYHPDKNSASYSKEVFHKISQAYDTLSDPMKRTAYDQKQTYLKASRQGFGFKEQKQPTTFFYKSSSFNSKFSNEFRWEDYDFHKRKAAEERMDEKARHERQKFRKQQNFKKEEQNYRRSFFKPQTNDKKDSSSEKFSQKDRQKENMRKQENYFKFQKPFSKPSFSKNQYDQIRADRERKERLEKQKEKAQKNVRNFLLLISVIVLWIIFDQYASSMRGMPVYSASPSETYKIQKYSKKLGCPFYVTDLYLQRAAADDRFREHIEKKMELKHITMLSKQCNIVRRQQQSLESNLKVVKSAKSREQILMRLQLLNFGSCRELHLIRQKNPTYFKALFDGPGANSEM